MTEQEWNDFEKLWQKARSGDVEAFSAVCEIVNAKLKRKAKAILMRVPRTEFDEAWQDAMLIFARVSHRPVEKLNKIFPASARALPKWLAKIVFRCVVKNRYPRCSKKKKQKQPVEQTQQPPELVGTKPITIEGGEYRVDIYAPGNLSDRATEPRPRLEPFTESIVERFGKTIFPDYVERIHQETTLAAATAALKKALEQLPPRWKLAIQTVYLDQKSVVYAAKALGCNPQRLHKLLKMGRRRLRELLANAACDRKAASRTTQTEKPVEHREPWMVESYLDEIRRGICPTGQAHQVAAEVWWPLVLSALERHATTIGTQILD